MNPHPPPPEITRRENGVGAPLSGDFTNTSTSTKYELLKEKSTQPAAEPAVSNFTCIQEHGGFGIFREISADDPVRWKIAPVPKSWGPARSTRLAKPPPGWHPNRAAIQLVTTLRF